MKYLTKEWCSSELEDSEIDQRLDAYRAYIETIYSRLPFVLKTLVNNLNLHDGMIKKVAFSLSDSSLVLEGVFGDLQTGYYFLQIKYLGVQGIDEELLISLFKDVEVEILSDEIELISGNLFSHEPIRINI